VLNLETNQIVETCEVTFDETQPRRFESEKYPHRVYKLRKALYGLMQAPRAWYGRLRGFLFERGFEMGRLIRPCFYLGRAEIS
jgi:hypothetical protein